MSTLSASITYPFDGKVRQKRRRLLVSNARTQRQAVLVVGVLLVKEKRKW